jgi:hypothetical protein
MRAQTVHGLDVDLPLVDHKGERRGHLLGRAPDRAGSAGPAAPGGSGPGVLVRRPGLPLRELEGDGEPDLELVLADEEPDDVETARRCWKRLASSTI